MSSIIGFLERMGRDSQFRHASQEDLAQALNEAGIERMMSRAILCGDLATLQAELYIDRTLCCLIYSPLDDDKEEEEREDEGGADGESEGDPEEAPENVPRQ